MAVDSGQNDSTPEVQIDQPESVEDGEGQIDDAVEAITADLHDVDDSKVVEAIEVLANTDPAEKGGEGDQGDKKVRARARRITPRRREASLTQATTEEGTETNAPQPPAATAEEIPSPQEEDSRASIEESGGDAGVVDGSATEDGGEVADIATEEDATGTVDEEAVPTESEQDEVDSEESPDGSGPQPVEDFGAIVRGLMRDLSDERNKDAVRATVQQLLEDRHPNYTLTEGQEETLRKRFSNLLTEVPTGQPLREATPSPAVGEDNGQVDQTEGQPAESDPFKRALREALDFKGRMETDLNYSVLNEAAASWRRHNFKELMKKLSLIAGVSLAISGVVLTLLFPQIPHANVILFASGGSLLAGAGVYMKGAIKEELYGYDPKKRKEMQSKIAWTDALTGQAKKLWEGYQPYMTDRQKTDILRMLNQFRQAPTDRAGLNYSGVPV